MIYMDEYGISRDKETKDAVALSNSDEVRQKRGSDELPVTSVTLAI